MLPYQAQYIENVREIAGLSNFYGVPTDDFALWYGQQKRAQEHCETLKRENVRLLGENLFPTLDALHSAGAEEIAALEEFADALMDWRTNLDCGVYVLIHDALLSLCRVRKDRNGIIRELYKLGMGLYYQSRTVIGIANERAAAVSFHNELVFTEAGAYFKYFAEIDDEETKGYIIRSLANIAICATDHRRRVAVTSRVLNIVQDEYYRALAPGLPWDSFLSRSHQQMVSNRTILSRGGLSTEELAAVLESCHEVFEREEQKNDPNNRWLWPYYEMEYSCGFADLPTTLSRLEMLIERTPAGQHDVSGLYGNVQLPVYYGKLLEKNPAQLQPPRRRFLAAAYDKMLRTLLSVPPQEFDELYFYNIRLVVTDYFETDGVPTYREITERLMRRVTGPLYLRAQRLGELARTYCDAIWRSDARFFDDVDFLRAISDAAEKRAALLEYAAQCAAYCDFGLIKMNVERLRQTRNLFEDEYQMLKLHTVSGYDDLRRRASTAIYADAAFGHHRWYNGADGYPEEYVRMDSQTRQMTDVLAVAVYLREHYAGDVTALAKDVLAQEGKRFSPLVTAFLSDEDLLAALDAILCGSDEPYYRELYRELQG